jgi:peptidoglycan hydrolase-like protein with peptidoglycan-binding domain
VIGLRRVGRAGFVCALPILALLVPQAAYATTPVTGGAISVPDALGPAHAAAAVQGATRLVSYHGVRVTIPAAWPVIDLRVHPSTCVRLDQAALYLGSPGPQSDCPAHAVGRADTVWLKPASAGQVEPMTSQPATVGVLAARVSVDSVGHDRQARLVAQGVDLQATWGADISSIDRVLASAVRSSGSTTTAPTVSSLAATSLPAGTTPSDSAPAAPQPASPAVSASPKIAGAAFTGMAFDTCAAPSASTMRAWLHSPYRAAGIYIGGSMRACGDGNLSASWVAQVHAMGWRLIPTYVGPQAPCVNQWGLATISSTWAFAQGSANAYDAVLRARYFGMGPGTPIYYDMEGYSPSGSCSRTVTTFISGWTRELHHLGYRSGAYGNPGSLMTDMSRAVASPGFAPPDYIWFAHWNGLRNTSDQRSYPGFADSKWSRGQRVHQYDGNLYQNWGGVGVSLDADWVNAAVAGTPVPVARRPAASPATTRYTPYKGVVLRQGSAGAAVVVLQRAIGATADGAFGPLTRAALVAFQRHQRIPANGIVYRQVWNRLEVRDYPLIAYRGRTLRQGSTGAVVVVLHRALRMTPTGVFGPTTTASVKAIQAKAKLARTGVVSGWTWVAIENRMPR